MVACSADHETPLDAQGRFTLVVSDPGDRPANATAEHGIAWLPWGGAYYDGLLIYRQMLPAPAREVMGPYYPVAAYCTKEQVEAGRLENCLANGG